MPELCECHKAKRPNFEFPHETGKSVFCMADIDQIVWNADEIEEDRKMNWRDGTWTLTEHESVLWGHNDDGEIVVVVRHKDEEDEVLYFSQEQASNMAVGILYQVHEARTRNAK